MGDDCTFCHLPRELHRQITVHVCYSDKVIKHWMCPDASLRRGPEVPALSPS